MYDYARSDTHFLLYIFDCIRNELLSKSNPADPHGDLVEKVCDLSKNEALQRYERYVYDPKNGSGIWGWQSMLSRWSGRFGRQQFAVFRAVHEWRDKTARQLDESIQRILTNKAMLVVAKEMPTDMPSLLLHCQPLHTETRKSAPELLQVIKVARAEGVNGPEFNDLIKPRAYAHENHVSSAQAKNPLSVNAVPMAVQALSKPKGSSGFTRATLSMSQFWGETIDKDAKEVQRLHPRRTDYPHLALPLPPLTAEVFKTETSGESSTPVTAMVNPGARAEHYYTKKRKAEEKDVFVLKQMGGSKKRKATEAQDRPEQIATEDRAPPGEKGTAQEEDGNVETLMIDFKDEQELNDEWRRKRERQLRKKLKKEQKERKKQEELTQINGSGGGEVEDGGLEAFDYEKAPSVLHARRENDGAVGAGKGFDPYSKSLDAPKGMRKLQKEGPGRSMTYKS